MSARLRLGAPGHPVAVIRVMDAAARVRLSPGRQFARPQTARGRNRADCIGRQRFNARTCGATVRPRLRPPRPLCSAEVDVTERYYATLAGEWRSRGLLPRPGGHLEADESPRTKQEAEQHLPGGADANAAPSLSVTVRPDRTGGSRPVRRTAIARRGVYRDDRMFRQPHRLKSQRLRFSSQLRHINGLARNRNIDPNFHVPAPL